MYTRRFILSMLFCQTVQYGMINCLRVMKCLQGKTNPYEWQEEFGIFKHNLHDHGN